MLYLAIFFNGKESEKECMLCHVRLSATLWTVAHQSPLSMAFPRQESWSGLPFPSPGDLLDPGIEPVSLVSPTLAGVVSTIEPSESLCRNLKYSKSIILPLKTLKIRSFITRNQPREIAVLKRAKWHK